MTGTGTFAKTLRTSPQSVANVLIAYSLKIALIT
jgi:hypothetical protein